MYIARVNKLNYVVLVHIIKMKLVNMGYKPLLRMPGQCCCTAEDYSRRLSRRHSSHLLYYMLSTSITIFIMTLRTELQLKNIQPQLILSKSQISMHLDVLCTSLIIAFRMVRKFHDGNLDVDLEFL